MPNEIKIIEDDEIDSNEEDVVQPESESGDEQSEQKGLESVDVVIVEEGSEQQEKPVEIPGDASDEEVDAALQSITGNPLFGPWKTALMRTRAARDKKAAEVEAERMRAHAMAQEANDALVYANQIRQEAELAKRQLEQFTPEYKKAVIGQLHSNIQILQAQYQAAAEAGDYQKVAEINANIAKHAAQMQNVEQWQPPVSRAVPEYRPKQTAPAVDTRTVEWWRSNQWYGSTNPFTGEANPQYDERKTKIAAAADQMLAARGIQATQPEYWEELEKMIGNKQEPERKAVQKPKTVSPPVIGTQQGTSPAGRRVVDRVTPDDRKIAEMLGIDPKRIVISRNQPK